VDLRHFDYNNSDFDVKHLFLPGSISKGEEYLSGTKRL